MKSDSDYALALAEAYFGLNDEQSGIKYLKKSIKLNKYNWDAYKLIIEVYTKLRKIIMYQNIKAS